MGRSKYGVRMDKDGKEARTVDGILFHSLKEAKRYRELLILERAEIIRDISLQPCFGLEVNRQSICKYVADFYYFDMKKNTWITEDVKGMKSGAAYEMFKLKKKLMLACLGIEVIEV